VGRATSADQLSSAYEPEIEVQSAVAESARDRMGCQRLDIIAGGNQSQLRDHDEAFKIHRCCPRHIRPCSEIVAGVNENRQHHTSQNTPEHWKGLLFPNGRVASALEEQKQNHLFVQQKYDKTCNIL